MRTSGFSTSDFPATRFLTRLAFFLGIYLVRTLDSKVKHGYDIYVGIIAAYAFYGTMDPFHDVRQRDWATARQESKTYAHTMCRCVARS